MKITRLFLISMFAIFLAACASQPESTAIDNDASASMSDATTEPAYSVDSKIGDILDDPKAKDVLLSYWPAAASPQMAMARGMSLRSIAPYAQGMLSDEKLQEIDQGLRTMTVNPNPQPRPRQ